MKAKEMRTYILTMPTRGTQTVLIDGLTAKDAIRRWRAGEGEPWRADHEITWSGVPRAIVDGGWIKKAKKV
jgi:hypothetical protein